MAAFRVAIAAAFEEAKKRSTNKAEFEKEAGNIFNTNKEEYAAAFQYVLSDYEVSSWTRADGEATTHSLVDALESAANSAFSKWSKSKSIAKFVALYVLVFKQQGWD